MRAVLACLLLAACGGGAKETPATTTTTLPKPEAPKTYEIHLSRPSKVGDKVHVVVDQTEEKSTQVTAGGKTVDDKTEKHVYHLDEIRNVVAVDDAGRPTKTHDDVADLVIDGHSLGKAVLDVTRARKEKDAVILVDGKPANKRIREALTSLLKLSVGGANDDEVFGTKTAQAAGAHWSPNTALARDDLKEDTGIDASTVTGDVWLEGPTRVGALDCLDVRAKMTLDGIGIPELPPGQKLESGHADVEMRTALPLDGSVERATEHMGMVMTMKLDVTTPKGTAIVAVSLKEARDGTYSKP